MKIKRLWRRIGELQQQWLGRYQCWIGSFVYFIMALFCPLVATAAEKVCFPPHIGLPYAWLPPTIDGYIEPEQAPSFASNPKLVETGWTFAPRVTYMSAGSKPMVSLQSLKHNGDDYIYLGLMVHYDPTFDDQDAIVLVFRPQYATGNPPVPISAKSADERRIDIRPVKVGVGLDPTTSSDDPNGTPGVRHNGEPQEVTYYRWDTASSPNKWVQLTKTPAGGINEIKTSEFTSNIKVRSHDGGDNNKNWFVEIKLPTNKSKGGQGWIDLSDSFGFYLNVLRVCTANTASQCTTPSQPSGSDVQGNLITEYTWPRADYGTGNRLIQDSSETMALVDFPIPPSWLGEAVLGGGGSDCRGVHFDGGHDAIGTQDPNNPTGPLLTTIQRNANNVFEARVVNEGTATAPGVTAEFLFAGWGSQNPNVGSWTPIPGTPSNPTAPAPVPVGISPPVRFTISWNPTSTAQFYDHNCVAVRLNSATGDVFFSESQQWNNLNFQGLSSHEQDAVISAKGYPNPPDGSHQNFLFLASETTLRSTGRYVGWNGKLAEGEFTDPSVLDKIIKEGTEEGGTEDGPQIERKPAEKRRAADDREQIPPPLSPMMREVFSRWTAAGVEQSTTIWEVNSYRETNFTLKIGGKKYRLYETATGFGLVGEHEGETRFFSGTLSGPGVVPVGQHGHAWRKQVKNGTEEIIRTTIEASSLPPIVCGCFQSLFGRCGSQRVDASPLSKNRFAGLFVIVGMVGVGLFAYKRSKN